MSDSVTVPVEPTEKMVAAARLVRDFTDADRNSRATYHAMLAAAPNTPQGTSMEGATERSCTCHPDDNPPVPCPQKYTLTECRQASRDALLAETASVLDDVVKWGDADMRAMSTMKIANLFMIVEAARDLLTRIRAQAEGGGG